jgi:MoaA/NifB/PqqE/SkfB family radical SAM enzyme
MDRIDLKVGFDCNNRCLFCVQGEKRTKYSPKTYDDLAQILSESRKKYQAVVFTGGEPTLHQDFIKLVDTAKTLEYTSIQIQTNGRMFAYKSFLEEVIAAGATEFSPAVHGHLADLHDYLTCSKGSFEQTIKGILNIKAMDKKVITNTVITRSNFRHLEQIAKLLVDIGVDQYQLAFVHPVGSAEANFGSIVPRFKRVCPHIFKGLDVGINASKVVMTEAIPYCFMVGYEDYVAEKIIPKTMVVDAEGVIEDYQEYRLTEGKAKGPVCKSCKMKEICEGPWREYTDFYGWEEFEAL